MKSNHIMEGNLLYSELIDLNVNIIFKKNASTETSRLIFVQMSRYCSLDKLMHKINPHIWHVVIFQQDYLIVLEVHFLSGKILSAGQALSSQKAGLAIVWFSWLCNWCQSVLTHLLIYFILLHIYIIFKELIKLLHI